MELMFSPTYPVNKVTSLIPDSCSQLFLAESLSATTARIWLCSKLVLAAIMAGLCLDLDIQEMSAALGFVISQAAVCVGTHCYEQSCCFCLLNHKVLESFVLVAWMQRGEPNLQLSSDLKQEPSNLAWSLAPPGQAGSSYNGLAA